jgi:hypothetical protein
MTCDNLNNPFSNCRNPVYGERFVGRHEIIRSIKQRVLNPSGGSLAIVGSPRIGKTSLANHVFIDPQDSLIEKKFLTFKINLSAFRNSNHLDLLRELVKQTLETFNNTNSQDERLKSIGKNLRTKDDRWIEFQSKVEKFFKGVKRAGWSVVAVIDEFDNARQIFRDGDGIGFAALRILAENPKKYGINLVTISRLPLHIIAEECSKDVSSFDGIFQTKYLQCFSFDELSELLDKLEIIGLEVNPELVDFVWENTGGHPCLASVLASYLAQSWLDNHQYNLEEALRNSSSEFRKYYNQSIELLKKDGNLDQMLLQTIFGPVTKETILKAEEKAEEMERYCGLIKRHKNGHYIAFSSHFENYLRTVDRPTDLWSFLNETQRKLRKLVNTVMTEKYHTTDWIPLLEKRELQTRKGKRLDLTNMGDLWEIISRHWNLFEEILGKDKDKGYWHFCLDFLSTVRSPMEYNYSNEFLADDKLKDAKEYCQEILDLLSQSSGGKDSKVSEQSSPQNVIIKAGKYYQNGDYMSKEKSTIDARSSKFGGGLAGENQRGGTLNDYSTTSESKQTLAKAAQEIQQLLEQLSQTYPTQTFPQKAAVAVEAVKEIENNPTLKERIRNAIKAMGVQAFMEAIDHPVANILREGIEAFKEPSDD